jgi:hypothetical protein
MSDKNLEDLYDQVDLLENRIENMNYIINMYDVNKEAYTSRLSKVKESREKFEGVLEVREYLNNLGKSSLKSQIYKSFCIKQLQQVKMQIDKITGREE